MNGSMKVPPIELTAYDQKCLEEVLAAYKASSKGTDTIDNQFPRLDWVEEMLDFFSGRDLTKV